MKKSLLLIKIGSIMMLIFVIYALFMMSQGHGTEPMKSYEKIFMMVALFLQTIGILLYFKNGDYEK